MKAILIFTVIAFATIGTMSGCSSISGGTTGTIADYYPHQDGYSWTYGQSSTISFDVTGLPIPPIGDIVATGTIVDTFNGTQTISTGEAQILREETTAGGVTATIETLVIASDDGVRTYGTPSIPTTTSTYLYAFPLQTGKTWTIIGSLEGTVVGEESVTVTGGTFQCFKLSLRSPTFDTLYSNYTYYVWLGKNAGVVKTALSGTYTTSYSGYSLITTVSLVSQLISKTF
ncbi:hypothetical protein A2526_01510 [candidate division WOR-1 bacterium RIFOXYD2_FULL_36_8]|uniref:Uncharacterized protein n=1 Tax=candidate division WOR-1 bacterium RIFOXYB2_FULL_36_35 TaxID=1802578 RepID=A0A1F4S1R8_UNCSA|nr:MAG: hypothetical protein A2230_05235 [candidate division WOR-1 bacterium RIFOXYA2_FULL_36_21]OGC14329.1 MAG: hypothetical protein A2290_08315 [candidate division WOR-1 bacterium RIFOXYB2_FULL_36_35]OGC19639.1 MAG: hypothetical protein A2282_02770 [candidate division WOR-1 bacterium RIFOXYA12_FULL_36_13]OGC40681.1 MAG: hypothetical protein A2526_01510 [candidate division WOR-1 bacterium RIFOXYD2_FULL_36_8]